MLGVGVGVVLGVGVGVGVAGSLLGSAPEPSDPGVAGVPLVGSGGVAVGAGVAVGVEVGLGDVLGAPADASDACSVGADVSSAWAGDEDAIRSGPAPRSSSIAAAARPAIRRSPRPPAVFGPR
ncbi:hypothetical protein GCM10009768_27260 [Leucobacter iarius]|uniref:Uncharacterized protein n=1 Tax=Leucobacter iarius TaxID=333963 RepID=A0ABP4XZP4_9MICO